MWWLRGRIDTAEVPRRATVQVEVADRRQVFWLVIEPHDASVCTTDPGFEVDAVMRADLAALYAVWVGEIELLEGVRTGAVELSGARWVVSGLPRWLLYSPVAPIVRAARAGGGTPG